MRGEYILNKENKDLRKNNEWYCDPTAYKAIKKADEDLATERFHKLLDAINNVCELSDFNVEGRIILKDKRTGRVWR